MQLLEKWGIAALSLIWDGQEHVKTQNLLPRDSPMSNSITMHVSAGGSRSLIGTGASDQPPVPDASSKKINVYVTFRMLCKIS